MFELQDLKILVAIAKNRGISKAAKELGYVQPNVTNRLSKLENDLGFPLFIRSKKEAILTPYGKAFYNYANQILTLCSETEKVANKLAMPEGDLCIGSMETTSYVRLPYLLKNYSDRYPNVNIKLQTGTTKELINMVLNNEIEGAFVAGPVNHPFLMEQVVFKEKLALITGILNNPLNDKECNLVVFKNGCYYREVLTRIMKDYDIKINKIMELDAPQAIINCVSSGLGISLIPEAMSKFSRNVYTYPVDRDYVNVDTVLINRKSIAKTLAYTKFIELFKLNN